MEEISQTKMRVALEAAKKVIKGNYQDAPGQLPTPKGVGMSREGYGQQVDKEA